MEKQKPQELILGSIAVIGSYFAFESLLGTWGRIQEGIIALQSINKPIPLPVIELRPIAALVIGATALPIFIASYRMWKRAALFRLPFGMACGALSLCLLSIPGQFRIFDEFANVNLIVLAVSYFLFLMVLALEGVMTLLGRESDIRRFARWEGTVLFSRR